MTDSLPVPPLEPESPIEDVIVDVRAHFGEAFVSGRADSEERARAMLNARAGQMTADEFTELGRLFNGQVVQGKHRSNRFAPAFMGATIQRLTSRLDLLNQWTERIWKGTEEEALEAASQLMTNAQELPGAGRSYPSMLLYLRNPEHFAVWSRGIENGLRDTTDYAGGASKNGREAYLEFSRRCSELREQYGLAPQEVDAVLTSPSFLDRGRPKLGPHLVPDTFQFLADLKANNVGSWMSENKDRYQRALREPFRRLLETVATNYVAQLDPQLETGIKLGKVLAAIRKRFPDESGEYYEYLWGAFTRTKKQEDVQLFAIIRPDHFRFGLGLGSAKPELRVRLLTAIEESGDQLLTVLTPHIDSLQFSTDEDAGPTALVKFRRKTTYPPGLPRRRRLSIVRSDRTTRVRSPLHCPTSSARRSKPFTPWLALRGVHRLRNGRSPMRGTRALISTRSSS